MATTRKNGPPARERPGRSSLTPSTTQSPRARPTRPSSPATSEKDSAIPSPGRKPTPNYQRPTFSSSPDASKMSKATSPSGTTKTSSQKSITGGKKGALDAAKPQPQRSTSFNPPRAQKPALASRSSFSERTAPAKGKSSGLSRIMVDRDPGRRPGGGGPRSKCSSPTSSANVSTASSPKAVTDDTMSNEDREAALDILNLDVEEHVLLEIAPSVVDKAALLPDEEPAHEEEHNVAAASAFVEEEHVLEPIEPNVEEGGGSHEQAPPQENGSEHGEESGKKEDNDEAAEEKGHVEVPSTEEVVAEKEEDADQKPEEAEEKAVVEVPAAEPDGEVVVAKVESCDGGEEKEEDGADGGGEGVKLQVSGGGAEGEEEAAPAKEKRKEAPPAYNDVIEKTASKLVENRKSKVKALVGAFETVIVMDSGGQAP